MREAAASDPRERWGRKGLDARGCERVFDADSVDPLPYPLSFVALKMECDENMSKTNQGLIKLHL